MKKTINEISSASVLDLVAEFDRMEKKIRNQRTELCRLNRRLQAMWEGVRFSTKTRADMLTYQLTKALSLHEITQPTYDIVVDVAKDTPKEN